MNSARTKARLRVQIARAGARAGPAVIVAPNGPVVCPVFAGRAADRAALAAALGRVRLGTGQTIAIGGEPGIGKSRLVADVCARADELGFVRLTGQK